MTNLQQSHRGSLISAISVMIAAEMLVRIQRFVAIIGSTGNVMDIKVDDMVQSWYDEVKVTLASTKFPFFNFYSAKGANGHEIGYYTQLVWAKSTYLGCGATKYEKDGYNNFYLVCNYGPAGNWIGEPERIKLSNSSITIKELINNKHGFQQIIQNHNARSIIISLYERTSPPGL
ncbi:hypothetical protein TSAR_007431 [Trichomalopsis sarcophagae]|uniref:SCP domain-containing protein n=1 Tax=Trichomalopsis sarcophagae TaxID=543379 RepID=A0A232FDR2_9HYME|nr:hypothetical protein TSAR_007431 [Trichomalopsis sarcophagae]